jgi:integrase
MAMGRRSTTGGVIPAGFSRIRFDFTVDGQRFRPTLRWTPNETNLQRARIHLARIKAQIAAGTFCFSDEFPRYRGLERLPRDLRPRTCGEIFDDFLRHEEARLARGDLAAVTVASHRKILNHVWRPHLGDLPFLGLRYSMLVKIADAYTCNKKTYNNAISALRRAFNFGYLDYPEGRDPAASLKCARIGKNDRPPIDPFSIQDAEVLIAAIHRDWGEAQGNYDELRFFTGLRPSEEIALTVTDYDAGHGVLSVTKARVLGIDKDVTKTGEDRRILLCPRAVAIIERQLRLRERLVREGRIDHEHLFFSESGRPIPDVAYPYTRWQRSLRRLAIRYRKPYMARHTSVSWNLMLGRNPLLVAKEHGHRITTMLSVYAAWTEGAVEADIAALRDAMNRTDVVRGKSTRDRPATHRGPTSTPGDLHGAASDGRPHERRTGAGDDFPRERRFGSRFGSNPMPGRTNPLKSQRNLWWKGRDSNRMAGSKEGPYESTRY